MDYPQIILIVLWAFVFGISVMKHGDPKTGTWSVMAAIYNLAIYIPLLYWGGFWL